MVDEEVTAVADFCRVRLASFFSPCSFPLVATLLAQQAREVERREGWARLREEQPTLAFGLFGFGYVLAGFG